MAEPAFEFHDNNSKNLIVAFASNILKIGKLPMFEFRRSLTNMKINANLLFVKDTQKNWYLSKLSGVGNNITHTFAFLRKYTDNHDKVVFLGVSAGGYASVLFGSELNVNAVIAFTPQTDLIHAKKVCERKWAQNIGPCSNKIEHLQSYAKYKNLKKFVENNNITQYYVNCKNSLNDELHDMHHYENIKTNNVHYFDYNAEDSIENGEFEKLLKKFL
jgi:esterase/lipase